MERFWELVIDVDTVTGRLVSTDRVVDRPGCHLASLSGRLGLVVGFITAGVAFAMQEVIGALGGWMSIATGRLYRVGDRVDVGGARGDVIDITPLRTKLMEMGSPQESGSWVGGRQLTGRIVSVTNKSVFTSPVISYSASFDFLWEELVIPVPYDQDWRQAEQLLGDAVRRVSAREDARRAVAQMRRCYPIPPTDLEPRVFVRSTDNWIELAARFVVPSRAEEVKQRDRVHRHSVPATSPPALRVSAGRRANRRSKARANTGARTTLPMMGILHRAVIDAVPQVPLACRDEPLDGAEVLLARVAEVEVGAT